MRSWWRSHCWERSSVNHKSGIHLREVIWSCSSSSCQTPFCQKENSKAAKAVCPLQPRSAPSHCVVPRITAHVASQGLLCPVSMAMHDAGSQQHREEASSSKEKALHFWDADLFSGGAALKTQPFYPRLLVHILHCWAQVSVHQTGLSSMGERTYLLLGQLMEDTPEPDSFLLLSYKAGCGVSSGDFTQAL